MAGRTLYVAGPMTGIPEFNYPAFNAASDSLRGCGYRVLNPVDSEQHNTTGAQQSWDWYMRHALRMVLVAQGVAVLPNWETSKGATLEVQVARALGLPILPVIEWIEGGLA